ncbi:hypothetical protein [Haloarchaeobius sp. DT45]|uniref:hypothetical protein n=1 Tax=Haloarchaeobius sp. DT45 TaxID=3446116 RepID=UPI003F6AF28D
MSASRRPSLQSQLTVYTTLWLTGLAALLVATGVGLRGHLGVAVAFLVMGVLGVGALLLYGRYAHGRRVVSEPPADPPTGPNGDGH